jgi:hypothetical protein
MNLYTICNYLNNFFVKTKEYEGFIIDDGKIKGNFKQDYLVGQYILIYNSVLNDGIYKITSVSANEIEVEAELIDEQLRQIVIFGLIIPKSFIELAEEIIDNGKITNVKSESISRYSVTYSDGGSSWQKVYDEQLKPYKKMGWAYVQ